MDICCRISPTRFILAVVLLLIASQCLLWYFVPIPSSPVIEVFSFGHSNLLNQHQLCVIIPYSDRWDELRTLIPLLHEFISRQSVVAEYIVVNQTDSLRFNRANLINVGYLEAISLKCDYLAMHDVDLVPLNSNLSYRFPGEGRLMHIAHGKYHPIKRYDYKNFIGGILIITLTDFKRVNGMSNQYWGWGLEDDEFYMRLRKIGLANNILRPTNLSTDRTNTFLHMHSKDLRRDYVKGEYIRKRKGKINFSSGLNDLNFTVTQRSTITIGNTVVHTLNVQLSCDLRKTPNCVPAVE